MGGVLLALQALMSYKRAKALEDTANAQAEAAKAQAKATEEQAKANQNTEQGQRQERLKNAIEHLGHASDSVRLGGAYELFHLAEDTAEDKKDLRQTVLDILCAHIRRTTGEGEYRRKYKSKPSEEIQSLLTLLFVQEHEVFKGLHINLQGSWLNGANLREARLERADLSGAYLLRAELGEARLQGTWLRGAHMQGAWLVGVELQKASLWRSRLQGADLRGADLREADLSNAQMQGADLWEVDLFKADLRRAQLQGVGGPGWSLGAGEHMQFEEQIRDRIGQESDLTTVTLTNLAFHDEAIAPDLSTGKKLAEDSHAITGTYTAEEAEQWIAEYNKAMVNIPKASAN